VVERSSFDVTTTANGDLQAKNQLELRNQLEQQATITWITPEGTKVKKGDLLCELNGESIQNELDRETPNLASNKAQQIAAENTYLIQINDNATALRRATLDLELKELALRQWREGEVVKRRQDLALRISKAELELERLADKLMRSHELLREGFISKDEADRDESSYIDAISSYTNARLEREVYETYELARDEKQKLSEVDQARDEVDRVRLNNEIQLASKDAARENQKEQVKLIENRIEKLRKNLDSCRILAPSDGLVVYSTSVEGMRWGGNEGSLQIGQQVYPNQLIIALPDTSEMIAVIKVHEAVAGRVRPGQRVLVKIDAANGKVFEGKVESIGVMAESGGWRDPNTREYQVKVTLEAGPEDGLKPAMRAEGRIILDRVEDVLTVPVQALFADGAVQYVYVPSGDRYTRLPVRVGRKSDATASLIAGVVEGQRVLLRQPKPGEVLMAAWKAEELNAAGYALLEDGTVVVTGGGPGGRPGRGSGGGKPQTPAVVEQPRPEATPASDQQPAVTPSGG
jgi:HlyD family secretion protein